MISEAAIDSTTVAASEAIVPLRATTVIDLEEVTTRTQSQAVLAYLTQSARSADLYAVVLRAARRVAVDNSAGEALETPTKALAHHLELCWRLDCFPKPIVALLGSPVSARDVSLTTCSTHRVATDAYRFAIPASTADVLHQPASGIAHILARLPHARGLELALTGRSIERAEAYHIGLVTHCVSAADLAGIVAALSDGQPVDPVLDALGHAPKIPATVPDDQTIHRIFSGADIDAITAALKAETGAHHAWADAALKAIVQRPPLVNAALHALLKRARTMDATAAMIATYRIAAGLRAASDKQQPDTPASLLDSLFMTPKNGDLSLPVRPNIQNVRF